MKHMITISAILLGLTAMAAEPTDVLIQRLAGDNHDARVQARQLLPHRGVEALPKLLPLIDHTSDEVWYAAKSIIADIVNQAGAPGHEADRRYATAQLMTLLAPDTSDRAKRQGLRLLPKIVPAGYDVGPIAALLDSEDYPEKARAALEIIASKEAALALCAHLEKSDDSFKVALLNALARIQCGACTQTVLPHISQGAPKVRAAALRALAWTADPALLPLARALHDSPASPPDKRNADDAVLQLADALALAGGKWSLAIGLYRNVLEHSKDPVIAGAAAAGLGRFGDESVIPALLAALDSEIGRDLEGPILQAFYHLNGRAEGHALLQAFGELNTALQHGLVLEFGSRKDALFLDAMKTATASEEATLRAAAYAALADSQLPGAVEILVAAVDRGPQESQAMAMAALEDMATACAARGEAEAAGQAFLSLYRAAKSEEAKAEALEGIRQYPVPGSFDIIMEALGEDEIAAMPPDVMAGIAKAMFAAGREEDANEMIDALVPRLASPQQVSDAIQHLTPILGAEEISVQLGVVAAWKLAGPFDWTPKEAFEKTHVNEPDIDLDATYATGDKTVAWKDHRSADPGGLVNLHGAVAAIDAATAYAYARIHVAEEAQATIRAGSDDGIKIWLNGAVVHENHTDRGALPDEDKASATFKAGDNDLLVRITQGAGGWAFCLRLTKPDGTPLAFQNALQ